MPSNDFRPATRVPGQQWRIMLLLIYAYPQSSI